MKKAADYAREYEGATDKVKALGDIAISMLTEINELVETRRARSNGAMCAILDEIDLKWRAFARRVTAANLEGIRTLIKMRFPDVYAQWMQFRSGY